MSLAGYFFVGVVNFYNKVFMSLQISKARKKIAENVVPVIAFYTKRPGN